ncbi:MAG: hypothetical protein E7158_00860 [Firmicutes bacterium]|nr:hypothetical protein [Bacillota bacterium]
MAKTVTITNGSGTANLLNGTYTVTAESTGYDNISIDPSSVSIESGTDSYAFTISATGTLTIHVTEDGTSTGTPVIGATFIRTDSTGTEYGSLITTDSSGNAFFNNIPYAQTGAPVIYYKQTASDGNHEFDATVKNTTLTEQTSTIEVQNALGALRTITLTDANYSNLPIDSATLTLTN